MRSLPLTRGLFAIVDDSDYDFLSSWKWTAFNGGGKFYAARKENKVIVFMHRVIAGVTEGMQVDHSDGNTLNNQRHNLRPSNQCQNMGNKGMAKNNTSGFKGVRKRIRKSGKVKWNAVIGTPSGLKDLGVYDTPQEAAAVYDSAATEQWGEFARTNKMMKLL